MPISLIPVINTTGFSINNKNKDKTRNAHISNISISIFIQTPIFVTLNQIATLPFLASNLWLYHEITRR